MARASRQVAIAQFVALVLLAGLLSFGFDPATAARFSSYGAGAPPISLLALTLLAGTGALWWLQLTGFFTATRRGKGKRGLTRAVAVTLACAAAAIGIDLLHPLPETLNARLPQSLLFYPSIALLAETVFHLLPLALIFGLTRHVGLAIAIAALCEPAFHFAARPDTVPHWSDFAVALNIFVLALAQLITFRRHGFAAMLALRLTYYLCWHILWGEARLIVLF